MVSDKSIELAARIKALQETGDEVDGGGEDVVGLAVLLADQVLQDKADQEELHKTLKLSTFRNIG